MSDGPGGADELAKGWAVFVPAAEAERCDLYQAEGDRAKHSGRAELGTA